MHRAAHFQDGDAAPHLAVDLHVAQQDNRVGEGGDVRLRHRFAAVQGGRRRGEQARHLFVFDVRGETDDELAEAAQTGNALHCRETINRNAGRLILFDGLFHGQEVVFEAPRFGVLADDFQVALTFTRHEINAPPRRIADKLFAALLEGEEQTALPLFRAAPPETRW